MKTGIELIAEERQRQIIAEGYDAAHDNQHKDGELADIAAMLAIDDCGCILGISMPEWGIELDYKLRTTSGRMRRLAVAGALIAAEIDRLQRAVSA